MRNIDTDVLTAPKILAINSLYDMAGYHDLPARSYPDPYGIDQEKGLVLGIRHIIGHLLHRYSEPGIHKVIIIYLINGDDIVPVFLWSVITNAVW